MPGQVLAAAGLTGLIGGIIEGGSRGFTAPVPAALIACGAIALVAFAFSQMRVRYPMVPPALFRKLGMRAAVFGGFAMILSWNGAIFLSTLILQQSAGLDPLASGLVFQPSAITCSITNMLSDRLSGVWSTRRILVVGIAILSAGYAVFPALGGQLSASGVAVAIAVAGSGGGLMTPTFAGMVLRYSEPSQAGIASAVFNTLRQVGGAVGMALFGALARSIEHGGGRHDLLLRLPHADGPAARHDCTASGVKGGAHPRQIETAAPSDPPSPRGVAMPHRYRETSLQCSRTTSTELLHATLAGLGPWARSHNHDVSTATVIPVTGANRREPAEVLDAVRQVHGEALGLLVVVVDEHELVAQALLHDGARHGKPNAPTPHHDHAASVR